MDPDAMVIGVDGGATRCRALVLDARGRERGRVEGPPALVADGAWDAAAAVVADVVREAAVVAGAALPVARLVAGLAGAGRAEQGGPVAAALRAAAVAVEVEVCSDAAVAFHDAFGAGPGILLVSGTGSMALGRSADGQEARAGGWGAILGDEGSGWGLGVAALRAVAMAADGRGPATDLTERILQHTGVSAPESLIAWVASATKGEVAALAPVVLDTATTGDVVATVLTDDAARALASAVDAVRRALEPWPEPPAVAVVGGLIGSGGLLRSRVERAIADLELPFEPREVDPARGAALRALGSVLQGADAGGGSSD